MSDKTCKKCSKHFFKTHAWIIWMGGMKWKLGTEARNNPRDDEFTTRDEP